jgi:large subunit ribosomal protein L25
MTEYKLEAAAREGGKPKHLRRQGRIPAVVYGHRRESQAISVDALGFSQVAEHGGNILINLVLPDGQDTVMVKAIQRDPLRGRIVHVDFLAVSLDEVLTASVPLTIIGDDAVTEAGGIVQHQLREIEVECLPTDVPSHITVDVSQLRIGDHITAGDLAIPESVKLLTDSDEIIITVIAPRVAEAEQAAEEESAESQKDAEPPQ